MVTVVLTLHAFTLMILSILVTANTDLQIYEFTRNASLSFPGKRLTGHVFEEFSTKRQVIHCAYECLKSSRCRSFNYERDSFVCQLNDGDHLEFSASLVEGVNGSSQDYHHRAAFSIDQEGIGPCAVDPCQNGGRCLDTMSWKMERIYFCICTEEWMGQNCETPMNRIDWDQWEDWGPCSTTCETGWTTRRRRCMDVEAGGTMSSSKCYGRDVEYQSCTEQSCPRWLEWSEWSTCSTAYTCGNGVMHRHRNCSNGGIPGKDRYCLGFTNETAPCKGINCRGMLMIKDTEKHGDGRIEIFDDLDNLGLSVCADDKWNTTEIDIACKQIGFQGAYIDAVNNYYNASVLTDGSPIYTLHCTENEKTIQQCPRELVHQCNTLAGIQCRIRGGWGLWGGWGECSVTCENGTRTRTRDCNHPPPNYGGTECRGEDTQFKPCTKVMCGIDGVWASWLPWSKCDVTCENGTRFRTRNCTGPFYGGEECHDSDNDVEACFPRMCPVDGVWNAWVTWAECSHTCGHGNRNRSRTCHGPFYDGIDCQGSPDEIETCHDFSCPVDGSWKFWSNWGDCSVTCGGGLRNRTRECVEPEHGGTTCVGPSEDSEDCNPSDCPIDGVLTEWEQWGGCSVTCANGTRRRSRECSGPFFGGANCTELLSDEEICVTTECPVDGVWDVWQPWQECNVTCGGGRKLRQRLCIGPYFGGLECEGSAYDSGDCNTLECPDVVKLNRVCARDMATRNRTCSDPFYDGADCFGDTDALRNCNEDLCAMDGVFNEWGSWYECDVTCGGGLQWRNRTCEGPFYGGADCVGSLNNSQACNTHECPIDGVWLEWQAWHECSVTCGGGQRLRNRTCDGPFYDGTECDGPEQDSDICGTNPCPIPGLWHPWSEWTLCTVTCGGGVRYRNRTCDWESFGDLTTDCEGDAEEIGDCHTFNCTPLAMHCADWASKGLNQSCIADVNPFSGPVQVECDFDTVPGEAITIMRHDKENKTRVIGYEVAGMFEAILTYDIGWGTAVKIVDESEECAQFIRWDCFAASIHNPHNPTTLMTFWKDRNGNMVDHFGGATTGSGKCACGETNSCFNTSLRCNCDVNDEVWRFDEGFITDKDELPVHSFNAGDTGTEGEEGSMTVGPLLCSGIP